MTIPGNLISTILTANPSKVINEIVTVTPTVMAVGSPATISITGGMPNTSFLITASGSNTSFPKLYASNYGGYTPFLNTYGAWTSPDAVGWNYPVETITVMYSTTIEKTQNYTLRLSADNEILLYIDDVLSGTNSNWSVHNDYTVAISAGVHIIRCVASNAGGPASFAAALYDPSNVMVWNTRPDSTGIASGILDATGNYTNTSVYVTNLEQPSESSRTYDYTVTFSGTGHIRPLSFTATRLDPYWSGTSLLLSADGVNGQNNNVFVDSSASNLTVTRYGNTTQGSVNPFMPVSRSVSFDSNSYLTVPASSNFEFPADYTIECWVKPTSSGDFTLYDNTGAGGNSQISRISGTIYLITASAPGTLVVSNEWTHIAVSRQGSSVKMFINGVLATSTVNSSTIGSAVNPVSIGRRNDNSYPLNGSISNLRVVKGTALYTANFTPSTAPLTAVAGTSLLTLKDSTFKDNSSNNYAIATIGAPTISTDSPFTSNVVYNAALHGGSMYFDGTGDYLTVANSITLQPRSGDFTIEGWVNHTMIDSVNTSPLVTQYNTGTSTSEYILGMRGGVTNVWIGATVYTGTIAVNDGNWHHIAWVRSGAGTNNNKVYVDGALSHQFTNNSDLTGNSNNLYVGLGQWANPVAYKGYFSNIRIVKGTAVYTANFTPPTAPVTAIAGTTVLLNGTNAGIYDATAKNDIETIGDAKLSTTIKKYGSASMVFEGSSDYLTIPANSQNAFNTQDFTVEFWVNTTTKTSTYPVIFSNRGWGTNAFVCTAEHGYDAPTKFSVFAESFNNTGVTAMLVSTTTVSAGTWYHLAITRSGNTFRLFVNGLIEATVTFAGSIDGGIPISYIGSSGDSNTYFAGYIDDFRITKGTARYTANFTPPTALLS